MDTLIAESEAATLVSVLDSEARALERKARSIRRLAARLRDTVTTEPDTFEEDTERHGQIT